MTSIYNYILHFRRFVPGLPGVFRHPPPSRTGTALPVAAVALAAVLAMTLAVTGGWEAVPHAGDLWQAAAPDTQPYQATDSVLQILDSVASALLPGYAFAQTANELILTATGKFQDRGNKSGNNNNNNELNGPVEIATFWSGDNLYAAVASDEDQGVQILDITDPSAIKKKGRITENNSTQLEGPSDIVTFQLEGGIYAAVASFDDSSVQILNITDPRTITAAGSISDSGSLVLNGTHSVAIFESESDHYAAVTAIYENGVQILNITDPSNITAAGSITDSGSLELEGPRGIAVYESGGTRYAVVAGYADDGVQIINITDPASPTAVAAVTDGGTDSNSGTFDELDGAWDIAVYEIGTARYAAVTASFDDGIQILNITDPADITAAGSISGTGGVFDSARGIDIFESGTTVYAAVASREEDSVRILNITDPADITEAGTIIDTADTELDGADGIDVFKLGGTTYAAVAAYEDDGVQIIKINDPLPEGAFVTTWKTTSADKSISIPVEVHSGGTLTIDWGDDSTPESVTANGTQSRTYSGFGEYRVSMTGDLSRINLGATDSTAGKLASIDQWGDIGWSSMEGAFQGSATMEYNAADTPDLSEVTSMNSTFAGASAFNGNVSGWDVSAVKDMGGMFDSAELFDQDLSSWDTSGVTSMNSMFAGAFAFNGNVSGWDVSAVTDMGGMFDSAELFDQNLSSWDTSSVTSMNSMFAGAFAFNGNVSGWDVSAVTDMRSMFDSAAFNGNVSGWDVSAVTDMNGMFAKTGFFNQNLSSWDTSSVTNMKGMFIDARDFNGNISGWDVSAVTDMNGMFSIAELFNGNISGWDVSAVTNMDNMFLGAFAFNQPLNNWNVSAVTDMIHLFESAKSFNQNLSSWDTSSVTNMNSMFKETTVFNGTISGWDVSAVTNMQNMFTDAVAFNRPLNDWDVSAVAYMSEMFSGAAAFNQPLNDWNVSSVNDMVNMFTDAAAFNQPLNDWNVSSVNYMANMFNGAPFDQNLGKWYVVPANSLYDTTDVSLNVTAISAQNSYLDGHGPEYGIDPGGIYNSTLFSINGTMLVFKDTPPAGDYKVNVTASGSDVFENGNNWHVLNVKASNQTNVAPMLTPIGSKNVNELATLSFTAAATDGNNDTLTFSMTGAPTGASINPNTGVFSWTPTEQQDDTYTITIQVEDGNGESDSEAVMVTVNEVNEDPVLALVGSKSVNELETLSFTASASDADTIGGTTDTLTFSMTGAPTGASIGSVTGMFSWTPSESQDGVHDITIRVQDGAGATDSENIQVTVDEVNVAPVLNPIGSKSVNQLETLSFTATGTDNDTIGGTADTLTFSMTGAPTGASINQNTGAFTWTPTASQTGAYTITVTVTDGVGASGSEAVVVTVTESNQNPVLGSIGSKNVNEGVTLSFNATATDGDNDALVFSLVGVPPSGASINQNTGAFTWTPTELQDGSHSVTVRVSDGNGGTDSETVTVMVGEVNQPPILDSIGSQDVNRPGTLAFNATATDGDVIAGNSDSLAFSMTGAPAGASMDSATGMFSWTPAAGQAGTHTITVTVTDGAGASGSEAVIVTVTDGVASTALQSGSKSRSSPLPPAITLGSQGYPQVKAPPPGTVQDGPLPPVPANGAVYPLVINENSYALHSHASTVVPTIVAAGRSVTISVTIHDPTPIAYFAIYLNLLDDQASPPAKRHPRSVGLGRCARDGSERPHARRDHHRTGGSRRPC